MGIPLNPFDLAICLGARKQRLFLTGFAIQLPHRVFIDEVQGLVVGHHAGAARIITGVVPLSGLVPLEGTDPQLGTVANIKTDKGD